ncbi:tRNA (N(6)-L-threonylcarbamoyladenosine(37)-C(2))-methylthiotransferase [Conexivisphaera calida]|uniref:tRNA-t(6)A37 methylthiotransferase n=1 Tax=Conexivisphaera calida TaxID=1874277 RepID=A0A4P2VC07_9ARCH|nr:tRNA (N(6)-L-threonylcarbamoyladenosine(37)-C(2))-methylthiotransferase [Conexivisphaera calida]BBE41611.1 putative tRNA N6-threonylcarbamoyladenosine 2-methylthiotransferase [Conexivisphaera calida]
MPRYYIETYGCAANQADGEIMSKILDDSGYERSADPRNSDVILLNTCGVKSPTENRVVSRLVELAGLGKPIVVAGCLTIINWRRLETTAGFGAALTPRSVDRVLEAVEIAKRNPSGRILLDSPEPPDKPSLTRARLGSVVGTIEVEDGCTFSCSFCATKFSRGVTYSYDPRSILDAARSMVESGVMELRLTGQDVASYRSNGTDLPGLVELITSRIAGDYRVRIGMMTPVLAKRILDGLVRIYGLRQVYKFAHLPFQSGSERILRLMRRGHGPELIEELASYLRSNVPMMTLETDIIVGHPGEDDEDFERTLELMRSMRPDVVNISKYGNRPGTEASRMKQVPSEVVSDRSRMAYREAMRIMDERNSTWMGWKGRALVTELGMRPGTLMARNDWYKPIVVEGSADLLGKWLEVRVTGHTPVHLNGEVTSEYALESEGWSRKDGIPGQVHAAGGTRQLD